MSKQPTLSWIWPTDDGVNGLRIDTDAQLLRWYDSIGCACGDSTLDQPVATCQQAGVPGIMAVPPTDVLTEIEETIEQLFTVR